VQRALEAAVLEDEVGRVLEDAAEERAQRRLGPFPRVARRGLAARLDSGEALDVKERQGWHAFVADYRDLTDRRTFRDRIRAALRYGRRAHELELRAEALLREGHDRL